MPDDETSGIIQATINRLSIKFNSSPFLPHITGCRVDESDISPGKAEKILTHIADQHSPFVLQSGHLKSTDHPFRKLFLTFKNHSAASSLLNDLNHHFKSGAETANLHLSLLYSTVNKTEVWERIDKSKITLPDSLTISSLALIKLSGEPKDWNVIFEKKLSVKK